MNASSRDVYARLLRGEATASEYADAVKDEIADRVASQPPPAKHPRHMAWRLAIEVAVSLLIVVAWGAVGVAFVMGVSSLAGPVVGIGSLLVYAFVAIFVMALHEEIR